MTFLAALALLLCGGPAAFAEPGADHAAVRAQGRAALAQLGDRLAATAAGDHMSPHALQRLLLHDSSSWVDPQGRVGFVDAFDAAAAQQADATTSAAPATDLTADQVLHLHSSPGSKRTIFLDFDGDTVTGTGWNTTSHPTFTVPGLDQDGVPGFNSDEVALIHQIWRQVAEDFAPFDVDVTTEDPGIDALRRTSVDDQVYGTKVIFTADTEVEDALCNSSCGGIAYLSTFDKVGGYQPAWAFTDAQHYDPEFLAQTASHETGHSFGLRHDGDANGPYSYGHGAWSPIMGGPTWRVSQWSDGDYAGATNTEDDTAIIAAHGAPLRADDHGDTPGTATALGTDPVTSTPGLISTRTDKDYFSLSVDCPGILHVSATGIGRGADADLSLRLLDSTGTQVAASDPPPSATWDGLAGLDGDLAVTDPAAGTYYVEVDGVGYGDPMTTGYSDYGSLGRYTLDVTSCASPTAPEAPASASISSGSYANGTADLTWTPPPYDGGSPVTGYRVSSTGTPAVAPVTLPADTRSYTFSGLQHGQAYAFRVQAVNAVGAGPAQEQDLTFPVGPPTAVPTVSATMDAAAHSITATWSPPQDDGGSPVTGYVVTARSSRTTSVSVPADATSYTFTGLVPGAWYRLGVRADNAAGSSSTTYSSWARLPGVPRAVGSLSATVTAAQAVIVRWNAPSDDGGTPVTKYVVARTGPDGTSTVDATSDARSQTFDGLARGTTQVFTVQAVNAVGGSATARATATVPGATVPGGGAGGTGGTGTGPTASPVQQLTAFSDVGSGRLVVTWLAPASDGGSPVLRYQVTWFDSATGRQLGTASTRARTYAVRLTDRASHYVTVAAVTRDGVGAVTRSPDVSSARTPGRTRVTAVRMAARHGRIVATVHWAVPRAGGAPISLYRVIVLGLDGRGKVVWHHNLIVGARLTAKSIRLPRPGMYRFAVYARNRVGDAPMSALTRPIRAR